MSFRKELDAYFEMAKPRITALLLVVALASYSIAAGSSWSWWGFFVVFLSVGTLGTGIFALNHWFERHQDALMVRTRDRPVPSGKVGPLAAQLFGWGFTLFGIAFSFVAANVLTGVLYLGVVALRIKKTRHEDVEISGLYWHFVDLVWMFVFPLIYLMSVDFTLGGAGH